jgi:hypothetical protein
MPQKISLKSKKQQSFSIEISKEKKNNKETTKGN